MATSTDYRDYRAGYTGALITKMLNSDFITYFSRRATLASSLKINARYLKGSELLTSVLLKTDIIKLYVSNIVDSVNSKLDPSEIMFLVLPFNSKNILFTYSDFLKLKLNKFTSVCIDILNIYLQCFQETPDNGNL